MRVFAQRLPSARLTLARDMHIAAQACPDLCFLESRRVLYHADKPGGKDVNAGKSVSETSYVDPQKVGPCYCASIYVENIVRLCTSRSLLLVTFCSG